MSSIVKKSLLYTVYGTIFFLVGIILFSFALFASKKSSSSYNLSDYVKKDDLKTSTVSQ